MPVSGATYERLALEESDAQWELHCGKLVEKPPMTFEHNRVAVEIGFQVRQQLDRSAFEVRVNMARLRWSGTQYFIPDVCVIPVALTTALRGRSDILESYAAALPLVVEVWSPSTGGYDVEAKLPEYQQRGDLEIWRVHPYERTLTTWRRQPDGSYTETLYRNGDVRPVALPGVSIDLDALFA